MVAVETIKPFRFIASPMAELIGLLALDEMISYVVALPILSPLLSGIPQELAQVGCITIIGATLALLAEPSLALR